MLPKKQRVRLKKDFDNVFKAGQSLRDKLLLLRFVKNDLSFCRGAVIVQAKLVPRAVLRNKIKRTISEILADTFPKCKVKVDALIIVRSDLKDKKFSEIRASLLEIFKKANIV